MASTLHDNPTAPRLHIVLLVLAGAALLALLFPAIQRARFHARQMHSANNLKQLALAFQNYEDTYRRFPTGADFDAAGPKHGWYTRLVPFIEASSLYSRLDMRFAWEHPFNDYLFTTTQHTALNLQIPWKVTDQGYALLHYFGNPNLVHRQSDVKLEQLTHGMQKTWLLSEVGENFQPWGYPFNWRSLEEIVAEHTGKANATLGTQLAYADGSVTHLDVNVDAVVLKQLDNAPPVAEAERVVIPPRRFQFLKTQTGVEQVPWSKQSESGVANFKKDIWTTVIVSYNGNAHHTLEFGTGLTADDFGQILAEFPDLRVIIFRGELSDEIAWHLTKLRRLEGLSVIRSELSGKGIADLAHHRGLQQLAGVSEKDIVNIRAALPSCQVSNHKQ